MTLLLDTCTLIWLAQDRSRLSEQAMKALSPQSEPPLVSAISAFEIGLKWRKGTLQLPIEPAAWFEQTMRAYQLRDESLTWEDAVQSALLPSHHNDPVDRMIIAAALRLRATIITPDALIARYSEIETIW